MRAELFTDDLDGRIRERVATWQAEAERAHRLALARGPVAPPRRPIGHALRLSLGQLLIRLGQRVAGPSMLAAGSTFDRTSG